MTTQVIVHPEGHDIEVQCWDKSDNGEPDTLADTIKAAATQVDPVITHVWSDRYVVVREVETDDTP